MAKRTCSVTASQFLKGAKDTTTTLFGTPMRVSVKDFSTGTFGWYGNGKGSVQLEDGSIVEVQLAVSAYVIGSKDAPRD